MEVESKYEGEEQCKQPFPAEDGASAVQIDYIMAD